MKQYRLHSDPRHRVYRLALRKRLTPAEAALWTLLKGKQFEGRKFRRQQSIGRYIVDFYCHSEQLVIELDGQYHFTPEQSRRDAVRDAWLREQGFTVLRFENRMVFDATEFLLEEIRKAFRL